jgi:hypothetical protein
MKTLAHEEVLNHFVGEPGTENRLWFENELKAEFLAQQFKELPNFTQNWRYRPKKKRKCSYSKKQIKFNISSCCNILQLLIHLYCETI